MKKLLLAFHLLFFTISLVFGQEMPVLKFKSNSKFKIVQFTDIHIQYDSYRSDSTLAMMKIVIEREEPDLVVITGDVVGSDNRKKAWLKVAQVMIDTETPWAAMLGNHDAEFELNKQQTMDAIVGLPYSLTINGPQEVAGEGNYVLPIQSAKSQKTAALCYIFDVSATNDLPENHSGVYEWIDESQVKWYQDQSKAFTNQNGETPLPALAFFHIPFPEFNEVIGKSTTVGFQSEREKSRPGLQSNLYAAMQGSKDVIGVFAGHHHNNNYIGYLNGISLGFGQAGGRQIYGERGSGARVIELYEGERRFDSWILKLYDNSRDLDIWAPTHSTERLFFVSYPDFFVEDKEKDGKINMVTQAEGEVAFRLFGSGTASVDWGDGSKKTVLMLTEDEGVEASHSYTTASSHNISINGETIKGLDAKKNSLVYIDMSNNEELTLLDVSNNRLSRLDVSNNSMLKILWCNNNQLTALDLSHNKQLTHLYSHKNLLSELNLSNNPALTRLNCSQNQLVELDVSNNTELNRVDCYENRLTALDLSKNTIMNYAVCTDNRMTAEGLNALFETLHEGAAGTTFVGGNPGEADGDRSIAVKKGWKVRLRY
jgi:hypothetical protein